MCLKHSDQTVKDRHARKNHLHFWTGDICQNEFASFFPTSTEELFHRVEEWRHTILLKAYKLSRMTCYDAVYTTQFTSKRLVILYVHYQRYKVIMQVAWYYCYCSSKLMKTRYKKSCKENEFWRERLDMHFENEYVILDTRNQIVSCNIIGCRNFV